MKRTPLHHAVAAAMMVIAGTASVAFAEDHSAHAYHASHGDAQSTREVDAVEATTSSRDAHAGHSEHASHAGHESHSGHAGHGTHDAEPPPEPAADHSEQASHSGHSHHADHADHSSHAMPARESSTDPHAGHTMPASSAAQPVDLPALTDADRAAAVRPAGGHPPHDNHDYGYLLFDRLEHSWDDGETGFGWGIRGWHGTDLRRWWLRSDGERHDGHLSATVEVLHGWSVTPWWDVVAGLRHDTGDAPSRTLAALGVQGVAPGHVEVGATLYAGQGGQAGFALDAEYDLRLTNRLILQAHLEADTWIRRDDRRDTRSGLDTLEAGLRLRYEIRREFAPYVGLSWERRFGDAPAGAGEGSELRWVAGLRFWF